MKLYIVSESENGLRTHGQDYYHLISEEGELIDSHVSSSKYWTMNDLYALCVRNQETCREKFGNDVQVLYLGDDTMTEAKLIELNKKFNQS